MNRLFTFSMAHCDRCSAVSFSACSRTKISASGVTESPDGKKQMQTIGMVEYRKVVENPGNALMVAVREPNEFAAGHVRGTVNIPRGVLEFPIWKQVGFPDRIDLHRNVIFQYPSGNRASLAAPVTYEPRGHTSYCRGDAPQRLATGRPLNCDAEAVQSLLQHAFFVQVFQLG